MGILSSEMDHARAQKEHTTQKGTEELFAIKAR
jgi:hypothetical protein